MSTTYERCMAYLAKLPPAISGQGGHNATLRAACEIVRFGLTGAEAWAALVWFNENRCSPPWSERELRHKLESAEAKATFGERAGLRHGRPVKPLSATDLAERSARRRAIRAHLPVACRSAAEEEAWWTSVAAERGMTLEEFDQRAGLVEGLLE